MHWSPQLFGRTQLLITASPENIHAQLNESAATPSPGCSACKQGQTIQHWHWCHCTRVCCEVWESSKDIWTHLNCITFCPWACSIPQPGIQWDWITFGTMFVCDSLLQHLLGTRYMQSTNIYKVKPILCFLVKKCANWLQTARTENGGGVGWQHAGAMQTNMVPLNFFSIVAPMVW